MMSRTVGLGLGLGFGLAGTDLYDDGEQGVLGGDEDDSLLCEQAGDDVEYGVYGETEEGCVERDVRDGVLRHLGRRQRDVQLIQAETLQTEKHYR